MAVGEAWDDDAIARLKEDLANVNSRRKTLMAKRICAVRSLHERGMTGLQIAEALGCSAAVVSRIRWNNGMRQRG